MSNALPPDPSPYRDDRPALREEVVRLRRALARSRRRSFLPAALGVALHLALRALFAPWLNGGSDGRFWLAAAVVFTPLAAACVALVRAARPPEEDPP